MPGGSASGIRAGSAFVELGARDTSLQKTLDKAGKGMKQFGSAVTSIGAGIMSAGAAVMSAIDSTAGVFAEMGDNMAKASQRTGITVEELSTLGYAAKQTGADMESVEHAVLFMNRAMQAASQGNGQILTTFAMLGISMQKLNAMSPDQRFKAFADGLARIPNEGQRSALAVKIFGRGALDLIPLLNQGSKGIEAFQAHAKAMGLQMSTTDAMAAQAFTRQMEDMWDTLKMLAFTIGSAVAPILAKTTGIITLITTKSIAWAGANKPLIQLVERIATAVAAAGAVIVGLGMAISAAGAALIFVSASIGAVISLVGFLLNPITLAVAAITALAGAFIYFSGVGTMIGNSVLGVFKGIWEAIKFVFENTSNASEAWGAIVAESTIYAQEAWSMFKAYTIGLWDDLTAWIGKATNTITSNFLKAWQHVAHAWRSVVGSVAKFILQDVAGVNKEIDETNQKNWKQQVAQGKLTQAQYNQLTKQSSADYTDAQFEADSKASDAKLNAEIAAIEKEYKDKQAILDNQKQASDAKSKADIDKAKADAAAAEKKYHDELAKKHAASGEKSLADQARDLFKEFAGIKPPALPKGLGASDDGEGGGFIGSGGKSAGTFAAAAAFGLAGGSPQLNKIANSSKKTADTVADILKKITAGTTLSFT